ncbi:glycerophosphoryl diester phosphodiesterase membrane domain-containing protein [Altererythrobacter aquiaggeris]|uniref:glycerophosphoryl diester phosphodiesterase membrane domain-containing protein n=1 Tax=Aestuarierythrobacter aquiaggeris TaxID=1898396 RepID=UPI003016C376
MNFDMGRTWQEAVSLVKANFQLLALLAGVFMIIPGVIFMSTTPGLSELMVPGTDPEQMAAMFEGMAGTFIGVGLIAFLAQSVGYMAMIALMGRHRPTVGEAIGAGVKSLLPLIAAFLVFVIVYLVVSLLVMLVLGGTLAALGAAGGGVTGGVGFFAIIVVFAIFFLIVFVMTRLSLTMPIIVLENTMNPFTALSESWKRTRANKWAIFGFYMLIVIAYLVLSMVIMMLVGAIFAVMPAGSTATFGLALANSIIGAIVAMLFSGILVSMHRQVSGETAAEISETFE